MAKIFIKLSCLVFVFVFFGSLDTILAVTPTPTTTPEPPQNSYVMFYPVVAGKTADESGYTFKLIRDRLTEFFAFGNEKKSEVNLKIATKRLLEAEKLFNENKSEKARNTLSKFTTKLASSYDRSMSAQESELFPELMFDLKTQTEKYKVVLNQMLTVSPESEKSLLEDTIKRVEEIHSKVLEQVEI